MAIRLTVPEEQRLDRAYWDQPAPVRFYIRCLYAVSAGLWGGGIMGWLGAPEWMQWAIFCLAALAALIWRIAFPNGMMNMQTWMEEGMLEAAKDLEKRDMGYKFKDTPSSRELEARLQARKEEKERQQEKANKTQAVKQARKKNRKNR